MEELIDSIFSDLKTELNSELTGENDQALLLVKVRNAVDDVECARNYQNHHTDEFKEKDLPVWSSGVLLQRKLWN